METRPYFLFGDIVTNALLGAAVGVLSAICFNERWPMLLAMAAGMLAGMAMAALFGPVFGIFFGAFELMVPVMLTGMAAGMAVPMRAVAAPLDPLTGAKIGAAIGLLALAGVYILNSFLRGRVGQWTR